MAFFPVLTETWKFISFSVQWIYLLSQLTGHIFRIWRVVRASPRLEVDTVGPWQEAGLHSRPRLLSCLLFDTVILVHLIVDFRSSRNERNPRSALQDLWSVLPFVRYVVKPNISQLTPAGWDAHVQALLLEQRQRVSDSTLNCPDLLLAKHEQ